MIDFSLNCNEQQLRNLASSLAEVQQSDLVVYLIGDLGSGKTTFARAFIRASGYEEQIVSPTYSRLQVYNCHARQVLHMDFYLAQEKAEDSAMLLADYLDDPVTLLIEWPDNCENLPAADLLINITGTGDSRAVQLRSNSTRAQSCIQQLKQMRC